MLHYKMGNVPRPKRICLSSSCEQCNRGGGTTPRGGRVDLFVQSCTLLARQEVPHSQSDGSRRFLTANGMEELYFQRHSAILIQAQSRMLRPI